MQAGHLHSWSGTVGFKDIFALEALSMRIQLRFLGLAMVIVGLAGCASSSVLVGAVRAPTDPAQVKIYLKPPKKFDEIALLDASSKSSFAISDQGKMDVVIKRLKLEASKVGANGILLQQRGDQAAGSVGSASGAASGYGNTAYRSVSGVAATVFNKVGSGIAIFVIEE